MNEEKDAPLVFLNEHVSKEQILHKLSQLHEGFIVPVRKEVEAWLQSQAPINQQQIKSHLKDLLQLEEIILPIASLYNSTRLVLDKRVLLGETNKKHQKIAQMAMGGSGVELDIVTSVEEGKAHLQSKQYDVLCANPELLELIPFAHQHFPHLKSVFITSQQVNEYYPILRANPSISNIVTRQDNERTYYLKNIQSTVSKLITGDIFGLNKYLDWGVEVQVRPITHSDERPALAEEMVAYLKKLGVRSKFHSRAAFVAEELLMNAIYDAPVDQQGHALYNHLSREVSVALKPEEQGIFRYACDGFLIAIAVEDPFGAFTKKTILKYLESCYTGQKGSLNEKKGGAGLGLFQVMQTSDLLVINVAEGRRTEVISIFNIDPNYTDVSTSFHYFRT